jgi:Fe-S oxidoreductase
VCCGRPLYDYGFLDTAERYLHHVLARLRPHIRAGTPVVGMEPSCLAVFKDELARVLPHDDDAGRLAASACHFGEFFTRYGIEVPALDRSALVWGHCHQRATGGTDSETQVLKQMGVTADPVSGGCCGLAGSWGFEKGKWRISLDCGEQALLPAIRSAAEDTLIVANGFSCKTQIEHAKIGRRALHLAQVMAMARDYGHAGYRDGLPERAYYHNKPAPPAGRRAARTTIPLTLAAGTFAGAVAAARSRWPR